MIPSWHITVAKADLIAAIGTARTRATLRRRSSGPGFEPWIVLAAVPEALGGGLSVRSSDAANDVPGEGSWPPPIRVEGAALRRLAPKLTGPHVILTYADGRLAIGTTVLSAGEI